MATKDYSNKQENMVANYLGWQVVAGSGAAPCHPGDIIGDGWLGECKTHETRGHKIFFSQAVWKKIVEEATKEHRSPVLFTDDGSQRSDKTWCMFNAFRIDDNWDSIEIGRKFRTNISLTHEELSKLYPNDDYVCYIASLGDYKVGILPLRLFYEMIR